MLIDENFSKKRRVDFYDHNYSKIISKFSLKKIYEKTYKVKNLTFNHFAIYQN